MVKPEVKTQIMKWEMRDYTNGGSFMLQADYTDIFLDRIHIGDIEGSYLGGFLGKGRG